MLYTTPASPTTTPYVSLSSLLRAFSRVYMWHAGGFSTQPFSVGSRQLFIQKPRQKGPMNRQVASYASFCVVSFFFVVCATCHPHQGSVYWTKMTFSRHFRTSPLCEYIGRCCCTEQKDKLRNFSKDPHQDQRHKRHNHHPFAVLTASFTPTRSIPHTSPVTVACIGLSPKTVRGTYVSAGTIIPAGAVHRIVVRLVQLLVGHDQDRACGRLDDGTAATQALGAYGVSGQMKL